MGTSVMDQRTVIGTIAARRPAAASTTTVTSTSSASRMSETGQAARARASGERSASNMPGAIMRMGRRSDQLARVASGVVRAAFCSSSDFAITVAESPVARASQYVRSVG